MKRIFTIQDLSCIGKCSLSVALPIISAMGIETAVIPTAILSTHTAFSGFTFHDLTSDIERVWNHWQKEGFLFDAIYTGYLASSAQLDIVSRIVNHGAIHNERGKAPLVFIDPCMGDNGELYHGFSKEFAQKMARYVSTADIIVPNMTEASFMLDIPYIEKGYDAEYVKEILKRLCALGAKVSVLKGITFSCTDKIGIMAYDSKTNEYSSYFHKKIDSQFHGTGDIFASVCVGSLMRGIPLIDSIKLAGDFVAGAIDATLKHKNHNWYGVDFEAVIPSLLERLYVNKATV